MELRLGVGFGGSGLSSSGEDATYGWETRERFGYEDSVSSGDC